MHKDFTSFIAAVKTNHTSTIKEFYEAQKSIFLPWALSRYACDHDTVIDVYQDAVISLFSSISSGKITEFKNSPEAYLFGIAKHMMAKKNIQQKKVKLMHASEFPVDQFVDLNLYDKIESEDKKQRLDQAFSQLKENCRTILTMFYYHQYSTEVIKERLEYNSTDVVKSRKNQCMKTLRKIMKN